MKRVAIALVLCGAPVIARAEPLQLRADVLASTASPVGLVDLTAGGAVNDWLRTDAVVWFGGGAGLDDLTADVLVIDVHARAPRGRGEATLGRFILAVGALRPLHLDGVDVRTRLPHRLDLETFAGAPVVPSFGPRAWDWLVGGRASRRLGDWGSAGVAYLEEREHGELSTEELGLDAGGAIGRANDATAKAAFDLISYGVAEAQVSVVHRAGKVRVELYGVHLAPSHLLPATSLFSVLGDVPSDRGGARVTWHAAPRLDLDADGGVRRLGTDAGPELGAELFGRATLRLDDKGRGALSLELRREGAAGTCTSGAGGADFCGAGGWTGARGAARVPLVGALVASTELELVRPDDRVQGAWWPWALAAVGWRAGAWDAAIAVEASASPEYRYRVDALARLSRRWEAP